LKSIRLTGDKDQADVDAASVKERFGGMKIEADRMGCITFDPYSGGLGYEIDRYKGQAIQEERVKQRDLMASWCSPNQSSVPLLFHNRGSGQQPLPQGQEPCPAHEAPQAGAG
jgi:hypothetical protein